METIHKYGIVLRLVQEDDAEFILNLRTDQKLKQYISDTSPYLEDQVKWIKDYKKKEQAGLEYYFIAEDNYSTRFGTIRIYNLEEKCFELGSWLFSCDSPIGMAVKTHFIGFETGFEVLKAKYCKFEIRKKNAAVLRYMQGFTTTLVGEDEQNFYYTLSKDNFYIRRNKLSFLNAYSKDENQ